MKVNNFLVKLFGLFRFVSFVLFWDFNQEDVKLSDSVFLFDTGDGGFFLSFFFYLFISLRSISSLYNNLYKLL